MKDCLVPGDPPPSMSGAVCSLWLELLIAPHSAHAYVPPGPQPPPDSHSFSPISLAPLPLGLQSSRFLSSQPLDIPRSLPHPCNHAPGLRHVPGLPLQAVLFQAPDWFISPFHTWIAWAQGCFFPECKGLHLPSTKMRRGQPESGGMSVSPSMRILTPHLRRNQVLATRAHLASFPHPSTRVCLRGTPWPLTAVPSVPVSLLW